MKHQNIEIKAKSENQHEIRKILKKLNADYKGTDHQIDIYYNTNKGRLKLRKGNIENTLIYYERNNQPDSKESNILLHETKPNSKIEKILEKTNGIKTIIDKQREIYFIDNVKFHIDKVKNLGTYIEIEAISENDKIPKEKLIEQCNYYKQLFKIKNNDLISLSYSDLIMQK